MRLELKFTLDSKSLRDFTIGGIITKDDVLKYQLEIKSPDKWNFTGIFEAFKHNVKVDTEHLLWWIKTRYTAIRYQVSEIKQYKNYVSVFLIALSPIMVGAGIASTKEEIIVNKTVSEISTVTKKIEKKAKKKKTKTQANKVDVIIEKVSKPNKKVDKKWDEVKKAHVELKETLKGLDVNVELPNYKLPENMEGKHVPSNIADHVFFTQPQFEKLIKVIHKKFSKYENDEYRINAATEAGRVSYEAFQRTTRNGVNGWKMSSLAFASGNFSGIKCFNPKTQSFVIKYDDGVDAIDKAGNSRFILFQRNDLFDFDNWMLFQVSHVLANKAYYNPDRRNYKDIVSYSYEFKKYATKAEYCKTLVSRARMVEKIIKG
jgi:hypothetical protein